LSYVSLQTVPEPRCCRSKCSVDKRPKELGVRPVQSRFAETLTLTLTLNPNPNFGESGRHRATDDQCSSIGRTQSSDAPASVTSRQSSAVGSLEQTPMNKRDDHVVDTLAHWKPVQLTPLNIVGYFDDYSTCVIVNIMVMKLVIF